jgi:hypothetical protein
MDVVFRATGRNFDDQTVETIIILYGIELLVLLLLLTYDLDLSPRFI